MATKKESNHEESSKQASHHSPSGYHKHKCAFCGNVWEHHDMNDIAHGDSGAHECPCCHRCNWSLGIYKGPEAPAVRNGATPPAAIHPDQLT